MRILLVDHEDSFVHNIRHALAASGAEVRPLRATARIEAAVSIDPDGVVLSPGPGQPADLRLTRLDRDLLRRWDRERPFLGICLGHEVIAEHYGAQVRRAPNLLHGETSSIVHDRRGIFRDLRLPFLAARYHSLAVTSTGLPADLEISARADDGVIMALRHRSRPVESVQFHPESYLTPDGPALLRNFLGGVRR